MDLCGTKKRKTFYGDSEEECYEKAESFKNKQEKLKGIPDDYQKATLIDLMTICNDSKRKQNAIRARTYDTHRMTIAEIEREASFARKPLVEVNTIEITNYINSLPEKSTSRLNKIWDQLNLGFNYAVELNIIEKNPLNKVITLKKPKSRKKEKDVVAFKPEDRRIIEEYLKNYRPPNNRSYFCPQLLIQLYTGLRVGEVNALTPNDVDFKNKVIHVTKAISEDNGQPIIAPPKTKKSCRDVPLFDEARPWLKYAIDNQIPNEDNLLFYNAKMQKPYLATNSYAFLKRVCEKHNIPFQGQHALRHTFATEAVNAGVKAVVLRDWLGHTSIEITLDRYYNNQEHIIKQEIDKVNNKNK